MAQEKNGKSDMWLKVLIGLIITLFVGGFTYLEGKKVDKDVFDLNRQNQAQQFQRIEEALIRIEAKVDLKGDK